MKHLFKNIHILMMVLCGTLLCGCNGFLDEDPQDRLGEDELVDSRDALFLNKVGAIYGNLGGNASGLGLQGTDRGIFDLNTFCTDEAIIPTRGTDWYDGGVWQSLFKHNWGGVDFVGDAWNYLFREILACNNSLLSIDQYAKSHVNEDVSDLQAEVRALRAMFYFYAMDLFGSVPLFPTSEPTVAELKLQPRSSIFRHIVSELQQTAPKLISERTTHFGPYYGRINQATAYFLLAKLMLNSEIYNDDIWTDKVYPDGSQMKWTIMGKTMNSWEAVDFYCNIIEQMGYTLEGDFSRNFASDNEKSQENIFVIPMDKYLYSNQYVYLHRTLNYHHAAALGLGGENGPCATIEALDVFGYGTSDCDPRFKMTYFADEVHDLEGFPIPLDDGTPLVYYPREVKLDLSGSPYEKTAGARLAKYQIDPTALKDGKLCNNDIVLMRYADVLLMRAEALERNGQDGSAYFNAVRDRVKAAPRECNLDNILKERMLELAWEGWRRNDLIRYRLFTRAYRDKPQTPDDLTGATTVFPISGDLSNLISQ